MAIVLTHNAKFKPYSFERLLQPLLMYSQEYNAVEEGIANLTSKAELMKQYALESPDSSVAAAYNTYSNELKKQADELSRNGLKSINRKNLYNLQAMYNSSIAPIETAVIRRRQLADEQRKALLENPTMLFNIDASTMNIEDLVKNPELTYQGYSGSLLTSQVSTAAANLKNQITNYMLGNKLDNYTNTFLEEYGFTPEEVYNAISNPNDPNSSSVLTAIVDSAVNSSPIPTWDNNENALKSAYNYANMGLWSAVGKSEVSPMENYYARLQAQAQKEKDLFDYKRKKEKEDFDAAQELLNKSDKFYRELPSTDVEANKKTVQTAKDLDFIMQVAANPDILNDTAKRYKPNYGYVGVTGAVPTIEYEEYQPNFERWENIVERYGLAGLLKEGDVDFEEVASILQNEIKKSAVRNNSYIMNITNNDLVSKTLIENSITRHQRGKGTGIHEYKNGKEKKQVSIEEVLKYLGDKSHIEYNPKHGFIVHGVYNNEVKSFVVDPEIITGESVVTEKGTKNKYQVAMDLVNDSIESNDYDSASEVIDILMNNLYFQFNSVPKSQSKTLSTKEEQSI